MSHTRKRIAILLSSNLCRNTIYNCVCIDEFRRPKQQIKRLAFEKHFAFCVKSQKTHNKTYYFT